MTVSICHNLIINDNIQLMKEMKKYISRKLNKWNEYFIHSLEIIIKPTRDISWQDWDSKVFKYTSGDTDYNYEKCFIWMSVAFALI